jgi:hypothetical protein
MSPLDFTASVMSVAPAAVLDYVVIALVLKLPLRLKFLWAVRGFPPALVMMAAFQAWREPVWAAGAICLGTVVLARLAQAGADWGLRLLRRPAAVRRAAA